MTYEKSYCPICRQAFTAADDVVVCPDCGTPHHRACWKRHGECFHADKHADGFEWSAHGATYMGYVICPFCGACCPPDALVCPGCGATVGGDPPSDDPDDASGEDTVTFSAVITCPRCGEECAADALVCPECGKQLGVETNARFDYNDDFFLRDVRADPGEDLDGFTVREASMYVQFRVNDYVRKFGRIKNGQKLGWNWAAFFFAPFWFFYRKIRKTGALFLGVLLVLAIFLSIPLQRVQQQTLNTLTEYITIDENSTSEQIISAFSALEDAQREIVQNAVLRYSRAMLLYTFALFLPNIAAALIADAAYKKKIAQDVASIREFAKNAQTFRMLALRRGGVSVLGLVGSFLIFDLVNVIMLYQ